MKKIMITALMLLFVGLSWAQHINNNGARIVSTTGSYWVVDNGAVTLTSESSSQLTQLDNLIVSNDASLTLTDASCLTVSGDITVNSGGNLTLNSGATNTASLIVAGSAGGTMNTKRYMSGSAWHLVSSPATGETIADFLTANSNVPTKTVSTTDYRGMMDYNSLTNLWNDFFLNTGQSGNLSAGKGYSLRTTADGTVTFTGSGLSTADVSTAVSDAGPGWNCVGNPFTSAISVTDDADAAYNFLTDNSANLDDSYTSVYVWVQGNNAYDIKNLSSGFYAQPGQAFMVKVKGGATDVNFQTHLQSHDPSVAFKSAEKEWASLTFEVRMNETNAKAYIKFREDMSNSLDKGYDAGVFKTGFDVYTKLVEDNGVDFGLQCLPLANIESVLIPVGLDAKAGEISFSLGKENFPTDIVPVLYDMLLDTHFAFESTDAVYTAMLGADTKGYGRFELQFSSVTGLNDWLKNEPNYRAWYGEGKITIEGDFNGETQISVFDIQGRTLHVTKATKMNRLDVNVPEVPSGVYLLRIQDSQSSENLKVVKSGR